MIHRGAGRTDRSVQQGMPQTRDNRVMFDGLVLPEWQDSSPQRLLDLFIEHQKHHHSMATVNPEFVLLLARLILMRFHQWHFTTTVTKLSLDPDDVAQECLCSLIALAGRLKLEHDEPRPLLSILGLRIRHHVLTTIDRTKSRLQRTPLNSTDVDASAEANGHTCDRHEAIAPTPSLESLQRHLRAAEDSNLRDIPGDIFLAIKLWRLLARHVTRGVAAGKNGKRKNGLPKYTGLPARLRKQGVTNEMYSLCAARLRRCVFDFAAAA